MHPTPTPDAGDAQVGGRVLVVDDDEQILRIARRILESSGFEIVTAGDGREALDVMQGDGDIISAVLLDLSMPVMGGVEALSGLRRDGVDVPVVICSGYGEDHVQGCLRDLEVQGIVENPFDVDALVAAVRRAAGRPRGES